MEYAASAILAGPIGPAAAAGILHQLRGYAAALTDLEAGEGDRVELAFTIRGGSEREAVLRALSLCDGFGYRIVTMRVLPA